MPRVVSLAVLILLLLSHSAQVRSEFPSAELHSLSPPCAQAGSSVSLRPVGKQLDELEQLIFSLDGLDAVQQRRPPRLLRDVGEGNGVFDVTISSDYRPGLVEVRTLGRFGISNPRPLLITQQPVVPVTGDHSNTLQAQKMLPRHIYSAQFQAANRIYFEVQVKGGQQLHCVAYAKQFDSRAIPSLTLVDEQGHELQQDRANGDWPAELEHRIDQDGLLYVVAHDFLYQGGSDYAFALEIALSDQTQAMTTELDQRLRPDLMRRATSSAEFSYPTHIGVPKVQLTEQEKLAVSELSAPFQIASSLTDGFFESEFSGKQGERLAIDVASSKLGQLTDPHLFLYSVAGSAENVSPKLLLQQDDGPMLAGPEFRLYQRDPHAVVTLPSDGTYRLKVIDHESSIPAASSMEVSRKGALLTVNHPRPEFRLLAVPVFPNSNRGLTKPAGNTLMRGGTLAIRLYAIRQDGFNQAIRVETIGLPEGIQSQDVVFEPHVSEQVVVLQASEDCVGWRGKVDFLGRAIASDQPGVESKAISMVTTHSASTTRNAIQSRLTDATWIAVNEQELAPVLVQFGAKTTLEVQRGAKLEIPIAVIRREGGQAECLLRAQNLPPKTTLGEIRIPADKSEATATLNVAADAPPGEYSIWLQNEFKTSWRTNPQRLAREEAYLQELNQQLTQPELAQELKSRIEAAVPEQMKQIEALKKQTAAQSLTTWIPSTAVRIRILPPDPKSSN